MDIYINKRFGKYSGGLAVVAANSAEEAHEVLMQVDRSHDWVYEAKDWQKLENCIANVTEPQYLAEDGYTE